MKRADLIMICEQAEHFLRSGLARGSLPLDMAESWARIHRVRSELSQDTECLPPITSALEAKDGTGPHRHVKKP